MKMIPDESMLRYIQDIRKTSPLDRREEQHYFKRAREGDKKARDKLVDSNMKFVLKVALQYKSAPLPMPDLVSEGAMGLTRAVESFDQTRGLKFISYAVWWIKAYITRAINEQGSLIRLPANQHLRVKKAIKEAQIKNKTIEDDIVELMYVQGPASLDDLIKSSEGSDSRGSSYLANLGKSDSLYKGDQKILYHLLEKLPEREYHVIERLFGLNYEKPMTLREVGEDLNISHERVRQLRDQALRKIRKENPQYLPLLREILENEIDCANREEEQHHLGYRVS